MDLTMPVMDGFEALKGLKADSVTKKIKVVILSWMTGWFDSSCVTILPRSSGKSHKSTILLKAFINGSGLCKSLTEYRSAALSAS